MERVASEGVAIAVPERGRSDRGGWLIYDPGLSPPNWIVSDGATLPAPEGALRAHLAYLRSQREEPIVLGFTRDGRLVSEPSGKTVSRPVSLTEGGAGIPVTLNILGSADWQRVTLPVVGSVRYRVTQ